MRREERRRRWSELIEQWKASGLTQRAYCERRAISYERFKAWRGRLLGASAKPAQSSRLVPVRVLGAGERVATHGSKPQGEQRVLNAAGVEIRLASARTILLTAPVSEVELARLVRLLEVLPC